MVEVVDVVKYFVEGAGVQEIVSFSDHLILDPRNLMNIIWSETLFQRFLLHS